jgi:uncharacterized protein (TIGR03086 family)
MGTDLMALYRTASEWTGEKVGAVNDLDSATPCEQWRMRDLLSHVLETQRYFVSAGRGEDATPPGPTPLSLVSDDPSADLREVQADVIDVYSQDGVIERTGPALGIAFADQLLHGWDVAKATGQDSTIPENAAQAAFDMLNGQLTDDNRKGMFGPEVPVGDDATPQQRLLAYTGRQPD